MASATISPDGGPVFFWREFEEPYGFLSQWYPSPFTAPASNGSQNTSEMTFLTTEQYMMYHKATLFNDNGIADKIMLEPDPQKQKALGRKVKGFENKKWKGKRDKIVEDGNWWKFTQAKEADLKKLLLNTGERELVEVGGMGCISAGGGS